MLNAKEMQESIVFFDGVCNLCNHFVDWLLRHDSRSVYKFASLQGKTAEKYLPKDKLKSLDSVVFFDNGELHLKSTAVLKIAAKMPAPWCYLRVFLGAPPALRDFFYDFIAKYRYFLFGKRENCRVPSPEEKLRFLD